MKMKKFYLFLMVLLVACTSMQASITIQLKMPETFDWTPNLYAWTDDSYPLGDWPGTPMNFVGNGVYALTLDESITSVNIIFLNQEQYLQTEDIYNVTASTCYQLEASSDYYLGYSVIDCSEITQPEVTYADPFQQAVLHETASVDTIIFINDETYPWEYTNGYICSTNKSVNNSKSEFSFTYSSTYQTQVQFGWINYYTSYHSLQCYVDGVFLAENTSSTASSKQFFLPAGTHIITFRDSVYHTNSANRTSGIRNIRVMEVLPLETVVLAEGSTPLTFQNEDTYPWIILSDGSIRNGNNGYNSSSSSFSTTFSITEPSLFSFECIAKIDNNASSTYTSNHKLTTYINDDIAWEENGLTSFTKRSVLLAPGTYTIRWRDWIGTSYEQSTSQIKNISLTSDWIEVELDYAGTLGVEVLYQVDVLADVSCLKVKGNLNSTDWSNIKQMTSLRGLDLSEASFTSIPANEFKNRSTLNYLILPEGLQTIGEYAFAGTQLRQLHIPSTVTSIGNYAFNESLTYNITFAEESQLQSIGSYCFQSSSLKKIVMPNMVNSVGSSCFYNCLMLDTLVLSNAITSLPSCMCQGCTKLKYVRFPQNLNAIGAYCFDNNSIIRMDLPESLRTIGEDAFRNSLSLDTLRLPIKMTSLGRYAFQSCTSLKYIELPSYPNVGYNYTFSSCTAVKTVVCPSATPPAITYDPFSSASAKSSITLQVPSVSVVSYKLDSYWYNFGTIIEGEDPDYWNVEGNLMLTNNRRISGKPDMQLNLGARLMVGGAAPMTLQNLYFLTGGSTSAALLNTCPFMSADSATTTYQIPNANKWYFLSPIYDVDLLNTWHGEGSQFVFRRYNAANRAASGTGSSWQNVTDGVLHHGQGYILQSNGAGWVHMPALNHSDTLLFQYEDVEVPLQTYASENVANENWNFIGNPYPAYYDIWYMDFTAPITVWTGSTYKAYSLADDNYALRPLEAFFVQKPETVDQIIFHKEGRQTTTSISHSNTESEAPARRLMMQNANRKVYNLALTAPNGLSDETRVVINDAASMDYELTCDASKFMTMDMECPQIYTIDNNGNRLAINERPLASGVVSLGVQLPETGEYTFASVSTQGITLHDNVLGISHDLHSAPYMFSADVAGEDNTRFSLVFEIRTVSTDIENIQEFSEQNGSYIYTVDGRIAGYLPASAEIKSLHLPTGVYMVRAGKKYTKIVVR